MTASVVETAVDVAQLKAAFDDAHVLHLDSCARYALAPTAMHAAAMSRARFARSAAHDVWVFARRAVTA